MSIPMGRFLLLYKIRTALHIEIHHLYWWKADKHWQAYICIFERFKTPHQQYKIIVSALAEKLFWRLKELLRANKAKTGEISASSLVVTFCPFYSGPEITNRTTQPVNGEIRVSISNIRKITKIAHTQYKSRDIARNLTQARHKEEHCEDGPRRSEGHGTAEDTHHDDGTKQCRLPAKPEVQI